MQKAEKKKEQSRWMRRGCGGEEKVKRWYKLGGVRLERERQVKSMRGRQKRQKERKKEEDLEEEEQVLGGIFNKKKGERSWKDRKR